MAYSNRNSFIKAVRTIYQHIDQPIQLIDVAHAAGLSLSSLKRLFVEATGKSAGAFIRSLRMELAFRSLQNKEDSVLKIALSVGFEDHSAFSRTFKEAFGYSPSIARTKLNIMDELDCVVLDEPEILDINAIQLQAVTAEAGSYFEAAPRAFESLNEKLRSTGLTDDFSGMYMGIRHDNPHDSEEPKNRVRFTAGITFLNETDFHPT